jgi:hypothetical protein
MEKLGAHTFFRIADSRGERCKLCLTGGILG